MKKIFILFSLIISTASVFAQNDEQEIFFDRKSASYGVRNKADDKVIIEAKYHSIKPYYNHEGKTDKYVVEKIVKAAKEGQLLDEHYHFIVDNNGKRISTHDAKNTWNVDLEGKSYTMAYYQYENLSEFRGRRYHIDEHCSCQPEPYFPCPVRVPMDTNNTSQVLRNIQKLEFTAEFKGLLSALEQVNKYIIADPDEPQYYFYKAWLQYAAFETLIHRHEEQDHDWSHKHLTNHFNALPLVVWDEESIKYSEDHFFQKAKLEKEIAKLNTTWYESNKQDIDLFCYTHECSEALYIVEDFGYLDSLAMFNFIEKEAKIFQFNETFMTLEKVKEFTKGKNDEIYLLACAWQHNILEDRLKPLANATKPKQEEIEEDIKRLRSENHFINNHYEGLIVSANVRGFFGYDNISNFYQSFGFRVGYSSHEHVKLHEDHELGKFEIGADFYLGDNKMLTSACISGGAGSGLIEVFPLEFTYTWGPNRDGEQLASLGWRPEVGIALGPINVTAGYHFIKRNKYPELRGAQLAVSYTQFLTKKNHYNIKHPSHSNLFDF